MVYIKHFSRSRRRFKCTSQKKRKSTATLERRIDGRTFHSNGTHQTTRYWICATPGCKATAKSSTDEGSPLVLIRPHSEYICFQGSKQEVIKMRAFMKSLLENADKWLKSEHVYNEGGIMFIFFQLKFIHSPINAFLKKLNFHYLKNLHY